MPRCRVSIPIQHVKTDRFCHPAVPVHLRFSRTVPERRSQNHTWSLGWPQAASAAALTQWYSMYGFDMADMTNMDTLPLGNCLLMFAIGNLKRWATTEECLQPWKKFEKKNMTRHLAISKSRVGFSAARLHSHLPPESQQFGWCRFLSDPYNGRQQVVHDESDALKFVEQCHKPPIFWWFTSMYGKIGELGMVYYSWFTIVVLTSRTDPVVCPDCNIEDALLLNMIRYIAENTAYT